MSGLSSLFSGSVTPATPTSSDTSTTSPQWYQDYVYNLSNAASNLASSSYSQYPGIQVAAPSAQTTQAEQMATNNVGNYQGALQQAAQLTGQAGQATNQGKLTSSDINQYLNPYTDQVVGALQAASNKNFQDVTLPSIQNQFVSAGQSRSPQEMQADNNALYNNNLALNSSVSQALQSGYNSATSTASAQNAQQLAQAQANRTAAQSAGNQFNTIASNTQALAGYDVGQVAAAGQTVDTNNQANINAAMNNFSAQQQWPYQNLAYASNIIRGVNTGNSNSSYVGSTPTTTQTSSPLASFVGTALGSSALSNSTSNSVKSALSSLARGGHVKRKSGALNTYKMAA